MVASLYLITICVTIVAYIYQYCILCIKHELPMYYSIYSLQYLCQVGPIVILVLEMRKVRLSEVSFLRSKDLYVRGGTRI